MVLSAIKISSALNMALLQRSLFLFFCFNIVLSSINGDATATSTETLEHNQFISGRETLVSSGGKFALGFFRPGNSTGFFRPGNSTYYYLGIWFNNLPKSQLTTIWVANRERPLSDNAGAELRFSVDGNLILLNSSKTLVWSTNLNLSSGTSTTAVLTDSGNLLLLEYDNNNSSSVVWQSFDHPTNTWFPGHKFGWNRITGETQRLISWKNSDDPSPGMFSLAIDPAHSTQFFLRWNSSEVYWTTGVWNGDFFTGVPEMSSHYLFNFTYVSDKSGEYFTYNLQKENSITTRLVLDTSGQIKNYIWVSDGGGGGDGGAWTLMWSQPKVHCSVYALCGPFGSCDEQIIPFCSCLRGFSPASKMDWALGDQTTGCRRDIELQGNEDNAGDKFYETVDVRLPDNPHTSSAVRQSDCEAACLSKYTCTAYTYNSIKSNCLMWHGNLLNIQQLHDGSGSSLYLRLAGSEFTSYKSKINKGLIAGVLAGAVIIISSVIAMLIWRRKRFGTTEKALGDNLVIYSYSDLKRATKNFSEKLGSGGFGSVFKGTLQSKDSLTVVAVKKLEGVHQGEKQFRAEVSTIGTIQHVNLVRLRGFCSEGTKRLLVYDYMLNGSLAYQLFENKDNVLGWKTRYEIALGTAKGLAYLHENCRDCIIHCDIKPENILLDSSFNPKVADFGLAKLVGRDFSRVLTTMRGTIGYLAPEWISGVAITPKADVYSYGLMLFEIVAGKRNWGSKGKGTVYYPIYAACKLQEGGQSEMLSLLDPKLKGEGEVEEIARVCKVACWCLQDDDSVRPTMGQIVQILERAIEVDIPPVPRRLRCYAMDNLEEEL